MSGGGSIVDASTRSHHVDHSREGSRASGWSWGLGAGVRGCAVSGGGAGDAKATRKVSRAAEHAERKVMGGQPC